MEDSHLRVNPPKQTLAQKARVFLVLTFLGAVLGAFFGWLLGSMVIGAMLGALIGVLAYLRRYRAMEDSYHRIP